MMHGQTKIKMGNVNWDAFAWQSSSCRSNKYYIFWVCVCSLTNPACNAHAPYCVICALPRSTIFFSILSPKSHDFRK